MVYIGDLIRKPGGGVVAAPCLGVRPAILAGAYRTLADESEAWEMRDDGSMITYVSIPAGRFTSCCHSLTDRVAEARVGHGYSPIKQWGMRRLPGHLNAKTATLTASRRVAAAWCTRGSEGRGVDPGTQAQVC